MGRRYKKSQDSVCLEFGTDDLFSSEIKIDIIIWCKLE